MCVCAVRVVLAMAVTQAVMDQALSDQKSAHDGEMLTLKSQMQGELNAVMVQIKELKEAAEKTGMSISALKVAVHRGMKSLKQTLRA